MAPPLTLMSNHVRVGSNILESTFSRMLGSMTTARTTNRANPSGSSTLSSSSLIDALSDDSDVVLRNTGE